MTIRQFSDLFALLAVQLRATDSDEATIRAYFETLQDIEPEYLAMAAKELARVAEWFPKTSEWRAMAAKIQKDRKRDQEALLRNLQTPLCVACSDTGWALDATQRAYRCDCQTLRNLELLGRRPWPKMIPATTVDLTQSARALALVRGKVRRMPAVPCVVEELDETA